MLFFGCIFCCVVEVGGHPASCAKCLGHLGLGSSVQLPCGLNTSPSPWGPPVLWKDKGGHLQGACSLGQVPVCDPRSKLPAFLDVLALLYPTLQLPVCPCFPGCLCDHGHRAHGAVPLSSMQLHTGFCWEALEHPVSPHCWRSNLHKF